MKRKAFTLIELLVVIAIIGLLSSIVLVSLNGARARARDAIRISDLSQLEKAVQLYYSANGSYPDNATTSGGDWPANYKSQLAPYFSKLPIDPLENINRYYGSYRMTWAPDANCNGKYVLWAYFEGGNSEYGKSTCGFGGIHYFRVLDSY